MVIPWVLDQTIVAMLSSLLPFYVQNLGRAPWEGGCLGWCVGVEVKMEPTI